MNELISVTVKDDKQLVSARELHNALELTTRFSKWVNQNFKEFIEGEDFTSVTAVTEVQNNGGIQVRELQDYALTIDMAKQLCMMSHTELGRKYRKYFIDLERKWNDPQEVVKRGYAILQNENTQLKLENEQMKPKALFADAVSVSKTTILVSELAKILRQNGVNIGANRLFAWMRENGYLISRKGTDWNMPTQRSMELGLFNIKETTITHSDGHTTISKTTKVTGKGQQYFINKFLKDIA
ncbi:phage antirepressor KilAC domain-containing protein [Ligilactobacillus animalis]|uniref:phage antirepressor KilAC domain-containing protein n=1 Tax=Ligilactobacillus animalis TaxID=1605 RepID=UPI0010A33E49|nr:phage antirepressor KilAC domain-containing protein [Ligilactobacillus animalis]THE20202.1 oxidoreductase [Ligilactobacillus animalis]THE21402.1 oxidoreductase [Ligilactobacillus animalis]